MKLTPTEITRLKTRLDNLLSKSAELRTHARDKDPVGLIYRYENKLDQEAAGFIASTLSYGRQDVFRPVVERILRQMGESPVNYIVGADPADLEWQFGWFNYRFNKPVDLALLLLSLRSLYDAGSSLQEVFKDYYEYKKDFKGAATALTDALREQYILKEFVTSERELQGFYYLIPRPKDGSACKRLNMFLRWMIRKDDIDVGNWTGIPTSELVIPLDTHVARISTDLGLTAKRGGTWKVAEDITDSLRQLDPEDPLRYDFAICMAGINGTM